MGDTGEDCLCTVDGTDFQTTRQGNMKIFWGHKIKNSGLRYELAICIKTGWIVWIHGPFPCGDWPDIKIFRHGIKIFLDENERVEADDGYQGDDPKLIEVPAGIRYQSNDLQKAAAKLARARHETGNNLLKQFGVLKNIFKHELGKHSMCFRACAVLTQLSIELGAKRMFDVAEVYDDLNWKQFNAT